ncbi:MAG: hypothetical protein EWM72_00129 [Nitrospira sp.]|nr:MAG: hypothetical protein EWM72_00129 [Nitrospira sp.]
MCIVRASTELFSPLPFHIVGGPTGCLSGHQGLIASAVAKRKRPAFRRWRLSHLVKDALGLNDPSPEALEFRSGGDLLHTDLGTMACCGKHPNKYVGGYAVGVPIRNGGDSCS